MKRIFIIPFIVCLAAVCTLHAQPLNRPTAEKMLQTAEELLAKKDYYNAIDWFEQYYDESKDKSVLYKIAKLQYDLRDFAKAERSFTRVLERDARSKEPVTDHPDVKYLLGRTLKMNEKYDDAIATLQEYVMGSPDVTLKALANAEIEGAKIAKTMKSKQGVTVTNAGDKINTSNREYSPCITKTGEMYFTSYRQEKVTVLDGKEGDYFSKVYMVTKKDDKWSDAEPLGTQINREGYNHGNVFVTPDGRLMYFTRVDLDGNTLKSSKMYYATRSGNDWSPANEVKGFNDNYINKQMCLGELFGKEVMFFVSNMEGGKGGLDIYYATRKSDGEFSDPTNLGAIINTGGDEESPYYRDGKLYFSSTGHAGIGGTDVFMSTWNGTEWSKPTNLGKDFNSSYDDSFFSLDPSGYNAFVVSNRIGTKSLRSKTCCDDIFTINIEKPKVDLRALTFEGEKTLNGTAIQLVEMTGGKLGKTENKTNEKGNQYAFPLELDKAYALITTKKGYYPDTTQFNTQNITSTTSIEKKIYLRPIPPPPPTEIEEIVEINQPIRLDKIYYDYDKWAILPEAAEELNYMDTLMRQYPDMVIELSSHTDSRGKDDYNMTLSQKRAESAKSYLVSKGIDPNRIKAVGYGESVILNQCANGVTCTEEEHRFNRRTEFKIIAGPTSIKITKREKRMVQPKSTETEPEKKPTPDKNKPKPNTGGGTKPTGKGGNQSIEAPKKKTQGAAWTFDVKSVDFGVIKFGEKKEQIYTFTNTGTEDLEIDIVSGCDCTDIEWTETPVKPGEKGIVKGVFNSDRAEEEDINKQLTKDLTIVFKNTHPVSGYPMVEELNFKVFIKK